MLELPSLTITGMQAEANFLKQSLLAEVSAAAGESICQLRCCW
jgi:hypothetical protein